MNIHNTVPLILRKSNSKEERTSLVKNPPHGKFGDCSGPACRLSPTVDQKNSLHGRRCVTELNISFTPTFRLRARLLFTSRNHFNGFYSFSHKGVPHMSTHSYTRLWIHLIWETLNRELMRKSTRYFEAVWLGVALREKPLKWLA